MTPKAKHTEGPWKVRGDGSRGQWYVEAPSTRGDYWLVAEASGRSATENQINAHLIAAAPDLLDALRACAEYMEEYGAPVEMGSSVQRARAAIARAEGRAEV